MIVIGDAIVKKCSSLTCRQQSIVLQHIECCGPGLMGMHDHFGTGDSMQWRMNALRGEFDDAVALERFAFVIEYDDVTGASFRPMQTEGQQQVLIGATRDDHGEVIVDAFFEAIEYCQTQGRG